MDRADGQKIQWGLELVFGPPQVVPQIVLEVILPAPPPCSTVIVLNWNLAKVPQDDVEQFLTPLKHTAWNF